MPKVLSIIWYESQLEVIADGRRTAQELCLIRRSMQTLRSRCRWVPHERLVANALTKRHGNSITMLRLLRDGVFSIVDEDQELAMRKTYRQKHKNVICDHIDKWSKRKSENTTDEMQWVVPTRSKRMRSLVATLEQSFPLLRGPMLVSIVFLEHVVSLCLSSSSEEHHCTHSCVGTGMRFGVSNILVILVQPWFIFIPKCLWFLLVCWWDQYHDTAISGTDCSELRSGDEYWLVCVTGGLATISRHCNFCARF